MLDDLSRSGLDDLLKLLFLSFMVYNSNLLRDNNDKRVATNP